MKHVLSRIFKSGNDNIINNILETFFILSYNNKLNKNSLLNLSNIILDNDNYSYVRRLRFYYIILNYIYILPENISNYFNKVIVNNEKTNIKEYINQLTLKYYN